MLPYRLIRLLSDSELNEFRFVTQVSGRKHSLNLFNALVLVPEDEEPVREDLFRQLFAADWSKKKDYKLRNELRHLGESLRNYLAEQGFKREAKEDATQLNRFFLHELRNREATEVYDLEFRKSSRKAKGPEGLEMRVELLKMKLEDQRTPVLSIPESKQLAKTSSELREGLRLWGLREKWRTYAVQAAAERIIVSGGEKISKLKIEDEARLDESDADGYLRFLLVVTQYYQSSGSDVIPKAQKVLDSLGDFVSRDYDLDQVRLATLNNLALGHYLQQDFTEARVYFEQLIPLAKKVSANLHCGVLYNYISAVIHDHDYTTAESMIEESIPFFEHDASMMTRLSSLQVANFIYLKKTKAARRTALRDLDQGSESDHYYLRLFIMISWYQDGDLESAHRENTNIQQNLRRLGDFKLNQDICHIFRILLQLKQLFIQTIPAPRLSKLNEGLENLQKSHSKDELEALPIQWIVRECKGLLVENGY